MYVTGYMQAGYMYCTNKANKFYKLVVWWTVVGRMETRNAKGLAK